LNFNLSPYLASVTVLEAIQRSAEFLSKKRVESPRLQAELLLAHVLQLPRMQLYLKFERTLAPREVDDLRELVRRRGDREPLQHIVGSTCFCGLEIAVNGHALIPRPETELLAEAGWNFLSTLNPQPSTALDFGTGTGCLAVTLAVKCPAAQVSAVDISPDALALARQNAARHLVESRLQFFAGDGFTPLPSGARFDLIISNPPYIPAVEIDTLEPEVRDHDPRIALDGGADGLDFYRRLAREAGDFLKPGGRLMLEFGDGQEAFLPKIFTQEKWVVEAVKADYNKRPRILIAHRAGWPGPDL
jgi:release factor glutamine methyltransferase